MRNRQVGQAFIARVAKDGVGALQEVRDGRAAHVPVGTVHLRQQLHVGGGVIAHGGPGPGTA